MLLKHLKYSECLLNPTRERILKKKKKAKERVEVGRAGVKTSNYPSEYSECILFDEYKQ